ncbi:MAG: bifunctional metallophosphatase/5'-nucleotidase [Bacillaceae bacterium]|nr:bifunctional metallophosphatase/5'-nucleotidase [Bacillaceae bacterium]
MAEKIFIYFSSDLHSHFENWPKMIHFFRQKIEHHQKRGETWFLLDNGDHMDRFHPITEAFLGQANVEMLNEAGYDCVTMGNNEGITLPKENLYHLYDQAHFQFVCANVSPIKHGAPQWLKPYTILTTKEGTRIGIIGLTAPFRLFYRQVGWDVTSPYEALDHYLDELKKQSDIVLLLSHLGINDDEEIARRYDALDVIIGGHTHHLFKNGEMVNGTLLAAAGKFGMYAGQIIIAWDQEKKKIEKKEAYAYDLTGEAEDKQAQQMVQIFHKKAEQKLKKPITNLNEPYESDWFKETMLMKRLVEELRNWTAADCAMLNAGVLLEGLDKGVVTSGDLHRICPHPMNPCKVRIKGEQIVEVIRMVHTPRFMEYPLKGFGFRGEVIGKMVFSNLDVHLRTDQDGSEHIDQVFIGGKEIEMEKTYELATADTFTFGRLLPEIASAREKKYFMPEFLRDLLAEAVKKL